MRMAVLWEQRKLVCELNKLSIAQIENSIIKVKNRDALLAVVHNSDGRILVLEDDLMEHMCKVHGKPIDDVGTILAQKRILNACINDGYIKKENGVDGRRVRIGDDKAAELLSARYFCFKLLPEIFPHPTNVIVSILTAALTSGAIWLYIFKFLIK